MRKRRIRKLWPFVLLVIIALTDICFLIKEKKSTDRALSPLIANAIYFSHPNQERKGEKCGFKSSAQEHTKRTRFTKMKFGPVYVFGAAMANSSETAAWDFVNVYSSMNQNFSNSTFSCCVKYSKSSGSDIYRQPVLAYNNQNAEAELSAYHHTCFNPKPGIVPDGIAITTDRYTCGEDHVTYRELLVPFLEAETKLALCTKAAYGNRSAELIIEWMETHKYLGVDKVVTYYMKDINAAARKVLEYYSSTGLLDLYYFEAAEEDKVRRRFHPPDRQSANDKQLLVFDSLERMSGYTYFGIIDHDEFLIPTKDRSLKTYLADLFKKYNGTTTGFKFRTQHFFLNLGKRGTQNDLILGRYITRPDHSTGFYGPKNIYKPKYVTPGKIHTHAVTPRPGFKMVDLPASEGFIRHYRECYLKDCEGGHKRVNDTWAAKWSRRIEGSVRRVRHLLFGTENAVT